MQVDPQKLKLIFREYDIRGIAGTDFDPEVVAEYEKFYGEFPGVTITPDVSRALGRALGTHLKREGGRKVLVGYEVRPHADILKKEFIEGILDTGLDVDDADKMCTPFIYFLSSHLGYDGGVNITGSHNVYFYNGYKIVKKGGYPIYGEELKQLYERIINQDFELVGEAERGEHKMLENAYETYRDYVTTVVQIERPLKVAIDCGNGTPGLFALDFFKHLGVEVTDSLYLNPDARFPNHVPDPESPHNMQDLMQEIMEAVAQGEAEIGIAFDADGDRAGFIDENGKFVYADDIILLFAQQLAEQNQGKEILFDVKCTQLLEDLLPEMGLNPLMHRTGHAPIKHTLQENSNIILGGEISGHHYFVQDYVSADDGFMAAARVLEIMSKTGKKLSELLAFIPNRARTPEIKLPCADDVKFRVVEQIIENLKKDHEIIEIDGARVKFSPTSWGLVRASNTSPALSLRFEAKTEAEVLQMKAVFADILEQFPEIQDKLDRENTFSHTGTLGYV